VNDHPDPDRDPDPEEYGDLARRLREGRPVPTLAFVDRLRRAVNIGASPSARTRRVLASIAGWSVAGALLLLLGAIGAAGAGPFGG
jgi:hypothetical protein